MDHGLATTELVRVIQEERLREAERRRMRSRRQSSVSSVNTDRDAFRMALGPGVQFAGVTEHVLDTVSRRRLGRATS